MEDDRLARALIDGHFAVHDQVQVALKVLRDLELTEPQAAALWRLSLDSSATAARMSQLMGCDASTITVMIDRREKAALVRRTPDPGGRRIKLTQFTERGCELRERIEVHAMTHSPFARLTAGNSCGCRPCSAPRRHTNRKECHDREDSCDHRGIDRLGTRDRSSARPRRNERGVDWPRQRAPGGSRR
ncbi:MarR family transcriptional regulator [Amycolatopsis azurea]|uniref:MarR family transcriptional regulator n=1 Tax=Amycolatopsis azurea TaxID=36819 RepID=UPI0038000F82